MKAKTAVVSIGGNDYTLQELTLDQGEEIFSGDGDIKQRIRLAIIACLANGGNTDWTVENMGNEMPFRTFVALQNAVLELTGLSATPGEMQATAGA